MKKQKGHLIKTVKPDSIAEEMGIEPGDRLLEINGETVEDIFDYQYMIEEEYVEVLIAKPSGEEWLLEIDKDYAEDLGVEFENGLMDDYRSCSNKCIFCFIDQMPKGMRETLYFKDDDSRLSFLQGNYVTLTNMSDKDVERVIKYHMSPINISFQTTNPELRCMMLHNRFAGDALKKVDRFYEAGIEMNGQIVLCKGVNDGAELERSISDMSKYLPHPAQRVGCAGWTVEIPGGAVSSGALYKRRSAAGACDDPQMAGKAFSRVRSAFYPCQRRMVYPGGRGDSGRG